jgi:hypothetical protein
LSPFYFAVAKKFAAHAMRFIKGTQNQLKSDQKNKRVRPANHSLATLLKK